MNVIVSTQRITQVLAFFASCMMLAVSASGCSTIKPYEREVLARPGMSFSDSPDVAVAEEHSTVIREGSSGGFGSGGGGCGCN